MALYSKALRQAMADGSGFAGALNGGRIRVFCAASDPSDPTGTAVAAPVTADAAETGTLMAELTLGGDGNTGLSLTHTGAGTLEKPSGASWLCASVLHSGPIDYWRFVGPGDTGAESDTQPRMQGTIGRYQADMIVAEARVTQGNPWPLDSFVHLIPAVSDPL